MNLKSLATLVACIGVAIAAPAGTLIANRAGFGGESWLMAAFAFGIVLLGLGPVLRLQQDVRDLQARVADNTRT